MLQYNNTRSWASNPPSLLREEPLSEETQDGCPRGL